MTHPLVSSIVDLMHGDLENVHRVVAQWVLSSPCDAEKAKLRYFGAELGAVQRRMKCRQAPPTREEVEIALTAVLALVSRRVRSEQELS